MSRSIAVIIPAYEAVEELNACLKSVLLHTPPSVRVLVIDDASPGGGLRSRVPVRAERIEWFRNESNRGYAGTCNRGMQEIAPDGDVILLNSDVVVTAGWVDKLAAAAYSRPEVASVTPFTNNGTICSLPGWCQDNRIPDGFDVDSFAALVESLSRRRYPELPTCVGHCVYLKRSALVAAGYFDESFGRGYGEENDLSCRFIREGFVNVLDDATFVWHSGSASFLADKSELQKKNTALLLEKHPRFLEDVHRFMESDALEHVLGPIQNTLMTAWAKERPSILHVVHNGPFKPTHHQLGGTELHVQDLIRSLPHFAHWSLVPKPDRFLLTAHLPSFDRTLNLPRPMTYPEHFATPEHFNLIHVHHTLGFDRRQLLHALEKHGNYLLSVHDFHAICRRTMPVTKHFEACGLRECITTCGYKMADVAEDRVLARRMVMGARRTITFSPRSSEILADVLGKVPTTDVPHGIHGVRGWLPRLFDTLPDRPSSTAALKVLLLGTFAPHKGLALLRRVAAMKECSGVPVEFHLVGAIVGDCEGVVRHGEYNRKDAARMVKDIGPHVALIPSIAPETYCLTADEAINLGVPVIVTPNGAPAARIRASGAGWVLKNVSGDAAFNEVVSLLKEIVDRWDKYLYAAICARTARLRTVAKEMKQYGEIYREAVKDSDKRGAEGVLEYLQPGWER